MNKENDLEKLNSTIVGFPGTIFLEIGDPETETINNLVPKHIELRLPEDKLLINYQFITDPPVAQIHVSKVVMHSLNSWDVYFYNYSGGNVDVSVKPLYGYYQR